MFAIHGKVELLKRDGQPLGAYARHYYDLYQLSGREEVTAMLASPEYDEIRRDYDRISTEHFSRSYFHPPEMIFANSDALFPPPHLDAAIAPEYEAQCDLLCYGPYPSWTEVRSRFDSLREFL